jgi:hypothetical protein
MEVVRKPNPLSVYEDHELLELMAMKDDLEVAHSAFNEFYARYQKILYESVFFLCRYLPNQEKTARLVFNNTFLNAYQYAHSFSIGDETDPEIKRKKIIGWLFAIAKTDLKSQFSSKVDKQQEEKLYAAMLKNAASGTKEETYNEHMVKLAIEQIPKERDREIFNVYWLYYEPTEKGNAKKLPDDVSKGLAAKFNTTDVNIRKIISRCNKIAWDYLLQYHKNSKK